MKASDKGRKLLGEGKVSKELNTDRRAHYRVKGDTEEHSVVFNKAKGEWSCDCTYSALKNKECSHITACRLYDSG